MSSTTHHHDQCTGRGARLYVALELSAREWRLAYGVRMGGEVGQVVIAAGDQVAWTRAMARARRQHGLDAATVVCSCYEAGRDAFWVHRWLVAQGVQNVVIDAASIEVNRRARRAKTDRLDAAHLLRLLLRTAAGERGVWQVVHVPTPAVEDARQPGRTLAMLKDERTRYRNRLHNLLHTQGLALPLDAQFPRRLAATSVGPGLRARLLVCYRLLQVVEGEMATLEAAHRQERRAGTTAAAACARTLTTLRGIGDRFAWILATEVCARDLHNRRQVGALTGYTPVPYQSGTCDRDQGISRAGLPAVRRLAVETAWAWIRWQPRSVLTRWFHRRFADAGRRGRRVGIVAVARRLVIALWRFQRDGLVPAGAVLKPGCPPPRDAAAAAH